MQNLTHTSMRQYSTTTTVHKLLWVILLFGGLLLPKSAVSDISRRHYMLVIRSYTETSPWSINCCMPIYKQLARWENGLTAHILHMSIPVLLEELVLEEFKKEFYANSLPKLPNRAVLIGNTKGVPCRGNTKKRWSKDRSLLLQSVDGVSGLSKIKAVRLKFVYTDVNPTTLCKKTKQPFGICVSPSIQLRLDQQTIDCRICTDKNRQRQFLYNLLVNTPRLTGKGSICCSFDPDNAMLLRFYASDTGCDIPTETADNLFDRFISLNPCAQRPGWRLSLCETIDKKWRDQSGVDREQPNDWILCFTHPYIPMADNETLPTTCTPEEIQKNKPGLLIAKDNTGNYKLCESILKQAHTLLQAWERKKAANLFEISGARLDLWDINRPIMYGYETTQRIRQPSKEAPVITVAVCTFASEEQRILQNGFDAYAAKPLNAATFQNQQTELIQKQVIF